MSRMLHALRRLQADDRLRFAESDAAPSARVDQFERPAPQSKFAANDDEASGPARSFGALPSFNAFDDISIFQHGLGDEIDQPVASAPADVAVIDETSDQPAPVEDCALSEVDAGEPEFENDVEPLATSAAEDEVTIASDEDVESAADLPLEASTPETPDVIADEDPIAPAANSPAVQAAADTAPSQIESLVAEIADDAAPPDATSQELDEPPVASPDAVEEEIDSSSAIVDSLPMEPAAEEFNDAEPPPPQTEVADADLVDDNAVAAVDVAATEESVVATESAPSDEASVVEEAEPEVASAELQQPSLVESAAVDSLVDEEVQSETVPVAAASVESEPTSFLWDTLFADEPEPEIAAETYAAKEERHGPPAREVTSPDVEQNATSAHVESDPAEDDVAGFSFAAAPMPGQTASAPPQEIEPEPSVATVEMAASTPSGPTELETESDAHIEVVDRDTETAPSPAEIAAHADLKQQPLAGQFMAFAQRLTDDLGRSTSRSIAFVSAEHQPHVTDVAVRTAVALAEKFDRQVLLVDAATKDKHLTSGFAMQAELGLAETLKGRLAWEKAVRPTGTKNLCVLPAGRLTAPPAAGGDSRLTTLLAELSSRFEFVLVDAGPLVENDAAAVAEAARDIYFVVRLGESQQRSTAAAVQKLQAGRARLRGCVVTNA